jgi:hypothetical protein
MSHERRFFAESNHFGMRIEYIHHRTEQNYANIVLREERLKNDANTQEPNALPFRLPLPSLSPTNSQDKESNGVRYLAMFLRKAMRVL